MDTSSKHARQEPIAEAPAGEGPGPQKCPAAWAIDLIAHKWTIHVVFALDHGSAPLRFRQLQRLIGTITQKELTKRLRELERSGLVERRVFAEVPPRVEYRLTELGSTLIPALATLHEWAAQHGAAVDAHWQRGLPRSAADR